VSRETDPLGDMNDRVIRKRAEAGEAAKLHLQSLIEHATQAINAIEYDAEFYNVSTDVMLLGRDLSEALREATTWDNMRAVKRDVDAYRRQMGTTGRGEKTDG
jgi:hypothetical protein